MMTLQAIDYGQEKKVCFIMCSQMRWKKKQKKKKTKEYTAASHLSAAVIKITGKMVPFYLCYSLKLDFINWKLYR